jgi:Transcriptional regulator, AbiEi antitoxin
MRRLDRTVEQIADRVARRAYGVATRGELLAAGVTVDEVRRRVEKGYLIQQHRGVYRVGHAAPSVEASYMAAVKACGEGAVLSGRAAAYVWRIVKGKPPPPEVSAPRERRLRGVKTARARRPMKIHRGLPIVGVAETLVDLAAELSHADLARACHEAGVLHGTKPRHVEAVLRRRRHAPGAGKLRAIMRGDVRVTLSKLERAFLALLRKHGLPLPLTNRVADARRVDCRWPEQRLTVELNSYTFHNSRYAWEQDHAREREARARRDEFRAFTYDDVTARPAYVVSEVTLLLARAMS